MGTGEGERSGDLGLAQAIPGGNLLRRQPPLPGGDGLRLDADARTTHNRCRRTTSTAPARDVRESRVIKLQAQTADLFGQRLQENLIERHPSYQDAGGCPAL